MAQQGAGRRIVDGVPLVVVLWTWVLPATVLWRLAARRDLVVPFVPWFVWVVPGRLWAFSPALWCIGLALATLAAYLVSKEALPQRKSVVVVIWVLTVSVGAVHLLWGSAVIRAARAWEGGVSSCRATLPRPRCASPPGTRQPSAEQEFASPRLWWFRPLVRSRIDESLG